MAAAKKTAAKQPAAAKKPQERLTKRWTSSDGDFALTLIADPGDFELTAENVSDEGEFIELAVSTEQIDELMAMLTTAKETITRYERGEKMASDTLPEPDEDDENDGAEEDLDEEEEEDLDEEEDPDDEE